MFGIFTDKQKMVHLSEALSGRDVPIETAPHHFVNGHPLKGPVPEGMEEILLGMGCFWGAERLLWKLDGVYLTMVGYSSGHTPNPTYEEVCSGKTGHNEVVRVIYDPKVISVDDLLRTFWQSHNPTQGMRQGNDMGTQYRSAIYYTSTAQKDAGEKTRDIYARHLADAGYDAITTEILPATDFYYAEGYHQQYLAKNPGGYCGLGGTGVICPIGVDA